MAGRRPPPGHFDRTKERLNHGKELFLRLLHRCNGKGRAPLCYENLMVTIAEVIQNLIKFQPLVLSKPMQVLSLTVRAQQELTKPKTRLSA